MLSRSFRAPPTGMGQHCLHIKGSGCSYRNTSFTVSKQSNSSTLCSYVIAFNDPQSITSVDDRALLVDRRLLEDGGIGTDREREYVRTFFDRSPLKFRRGESMRSICERLQIKTHVLGLKEGASVAAGAGSCSPKL